MKFWEEKKKTLAVIAVVLFGVALLTLFPQVLSEFFVAVGHLVEEEGGYAMLSFFDICAICFRMLVPAAFAAFVLVNMRTGKHSYLLAVASGLAVVWMLITLFLGVFRLDFTNLGRVLYDFVWNCLPAQSVPYILFGGLIVFAFKRVKGIAVPLILATVISCLLVDTVYDNAIGFMSEIAWLIGYGNYGGVMRALGDVVSNATAVVYDLAFYGGLLLAVPLALWVKEPAQE